MDVKFQVFISSTFEDLKDERRIVMEQILNLGHIPVGMELFQAGNDNQWAHIQRRIAECDYYLVIVAERYGSEEGGKSYTQLEYEWAVEQGIPVAAFLLDGEARASWPSSKVEHDKQHKVEAFRALCQKKLVKYWANGDQLGARVTTALVEMFRENPRPGWVRGNTASSAAALDELAKLSEEKRSLQSELEGYKAAASNAPPPEVQRRLDILSKKFLRDYIPELRGDDGMHLLSTFVAISRTLANVANEYDIYQTLEKLGLTYSSDWDALHPFIAELVANNLVSVTHVAASNGSRKMFGLTEYAKQFLMYAEGPKEE